MNMGVYLNTGHWQSALCCMCYGDIVDLAVPQDKLCCYLFVDEGNRVERTKLSSHVLRTHKFDSWVFSPSVLQFQPAHFSRLFPLTSDSSCLFFTICYCLC